MRTKATKPKVDPYLEGLMGKLLERFANLERKMDALLSQSGKSGGGSQSHQPQPPLQPKRERQMYEAICADCSKVCEVPFQPSEDRAVYCKQCFAKRKTGNRPQINTRPGMPVLTPVAMPARPANKPMPVPTAVSEKAKKKPAKKTKKKK